MNRVIVVLVAVLSSFTFLHSGGTDAYGGHYDHSTGAYHYHHGYSAHSHYDMNGDGVVDCPYTFKDNTNKGGKINKEQTSSKDNTIDESNTNETESNISNAPVSSDNGAESHKSETTFKDVIEIVICVAVFSTLAFAVITAFLIAVVDEVAALAKKRGNKGLDFLESDKFCKSTFSVVAIISIVIVLLIMLRAKGII